MLKFYDEMPEMTFFAGDTLPTFTITVDSENLDGCEMQMLISKLKPSENAIIEKTVFPHQKALRFSLQAVKQKI